MIFFADANISPQAAKLLAVFDRDNQMRHHNEAFDEGADDIVWMKGVAAWDPKPSVLCGDGRILRRPAEKAALRQADLTFFVLAKGWMNEPWTSFAWRIIKVWPSIVEAAGHTRRPTIFEVTINGKVEALRLTAELK